MREKLKAVVVGAGLNGLGVIRSLAEISVPTILVEASFSDPAAKTRLSSRYKVRSLQDVSLIEDLLRLGSTFDQRPILYLTQEKSVRLVSEHRAALSKAFAFNLPDDTVVSSLTTKAGFRERAQQLGAPIPRTYLLQRIEDLGQIRNMRFPLILKPNERHPLYDSRYKKAYRCETLDELSGRVAEILPTCPALIAQEWIEGNDSDIYFCLQYRAASGAPIMSFCGRKNRSHPPMVGGTASCTIAPLEAWKPLEQATNDFFSAARVIGLASMEFKQDTRSGEFLMVEPTIGRTDFQEEVATLNGFNVPAAAYADLAGLPVPLLAPRHRNIIWLDPDAEAKSKLAMPGIADFAGSRRDAYFSPKDPVPWLYRRLLQIRNRLGRISL